MKNRREVLGKIISDNIRAERNRCKLSQDYVASQLDVTLRTYTSYERNAKNVEATTLIILSKLFECDINAFYLHI